MFDMTHGFVAEALSLRGANYKLKKYKKTNNHGNIKIVTKYGNAIKQQEEK